MNTKVTLASRKGGVFYIRKLAKSGNSRYLSVGSILPKEWLAVKVFVVEATHDHWVLRLEAIS